MSSTQTRCSKCQNLFIPKQYLEHSEHCEGFISRSNDQSYFQNNQSSQIDTVCLNEQLNQISSINQTQIQTFDVEVLDYIFQDKSGSQRPLEYVVKVNYYDRSWRVQKTYREILKYIRSIEASFQQSPIENGIEKILLIKDQSL